MGKLKHSIIVLLILISNTILAQNTPPPPLPVPLPGLSIDSYVLILLVIGLFVGTFLLVKKVKNRTN